MRAGEFDTTSRRGCRSRPAALHDALTFAAADLGYGPNLFYYLRHDGAGLSTFGTISTTGAVTDRFGVGTDFDALTFEPGNVGYGPNRFYYVCESIS